MLGLVKILVDGVICALHTHDGTQLELVAERLGTRLSVPAADLAGLLSGNPSGVLGARRLLWPFRDFVQWNPADDAIIHLRIATMASPTWQLSATLKDLERAPDPVA
jgi:hypothetical protein